MWLKRMRRGPMDAVERAILTAHRGLVGNTDQGGGCQITLVAQEVWHALRARVGASLPPSTRRANLWRSGIRLVNSRQRSLRMGSRRRQHCTTPRQGYHSQRLPSHLRRRVDMP